MVKSAMGRHLDRNGILATPDCRGAVQSQRPAPLGVDRLDEAFHRRPVDHPVDLVEEFRLHFAPATRSANPRVLFVCCFIP